MLPTAPRPRTRSPLVHLLLLFVAVTGALLAGAAPASAHAALTGSDPGQGSVVQQAPDKVTLHFTENVAMSADSVRVLDPKGKRVDKGEIKEVGGAKSASYEKQLVAGLPDGTFTVAWKAVSTDSHPVSGAFSFSIGAPSDTTVQLSGQEAGGGVVGVLYGFARYVSYAAFTLMAGGAAFVLICWPKGATARPLQRLVAYGWVALTAATLALLMLRGPYTDSGKLSDVFDLAQISEVLQTKTGAALVSRLLLLAAAALFIAVLFGAYAKREDEKEKRDLTFGLAIGGTVVAAGIASTWALAEHASSGIQTGIAMPVDVLHLLAVAAWLGGLTALLMALYRVPSLEASAARRFSSLAFWSVVVLAATGLYQSWRQVGSWSALTGTSYGQLLLVKIGLVAVLLGVGWISRRWTAGLAETVVSESAKAGEQRTTVGVGAGKPAAGKTPAGKTPTGKTPKNPKRAAQLARQQAAVAAAREKRLRDADPSRAGLRRSVLAEAGVAVVLLAVTTVLTSTEPGRTVEQSEQSAPVAANQPLDVTLPFDTKGEDGKGNLRIDLTPGRTGANELHVWATRPNGKPFDLPEVKVAFTLEAKDIGPLPVTPDRIVTGHWSSTGVQIPMGGEWEIAVTVRTSDIDQVTVRKNVKIG
ncbi:copper resistance protein CopC/CopD [Streptomyces sp. TRM66268-LWL]|uniref:Copper resistance protein CopC/CopD n=1 Tax=Streptomyces polyasparticus TaxID=2767826 RepID=A0ABR7SIJ0_9ACTN|nr:copper resistance protein CopC [Streptomyces polyasparticus]MBC9714133.1 copper resistance protein CopC/CopD [Streptomyces polyasparticus]